MEVELEAQRADGVSSGESESEPESVIGYAVGVESRHLHRIECAGCAEQSW